VYRQRRQHQPIPYIWEALQHKARCGGRGPAKVKLIYPLPYHHKLHRRRHSAGNVNVGYSIVSPGHVAATGTAPSADHVSANKLVGQAIRAGGERQNKSVEGVGQELAAAARESGPSYEKKDSLFIV
jgi:hypothetical protein